MSNNQYSATNSIVITGLGAVTPLGNSVAAFWRKLIEGKHGFGPITIFDAQKHRTRFAAQVKELPDFEPKRLDAKLLSRSDVMQLAAVKEALAQAKLYDTKSGASLASTIGIISATAAGGILGLEAFFRYRYHNQPCEPAHLLTSFCLSATATNVAKEFVIAGPRTTTATVCSSSGLSLAVALELLRMGELQQVLVIASESLCEVTHAGFNSLRSIAPEFCRPFDTNRKGLVLGEGAGAMILETASSAEKREAEILSTLEGYGLTTDLHHFTAPDPKGDAIAETITTALGDSDIAPAQIDYINAHGTGTPLNDAAECQGIKEVFGPDIKNIPVSSSKSMIGHTLGAASLLEGIAAVKALQEGIVPPTANIKDPDTECGLDIVPNKAKKRGITAALSNSFAFGGSNISVLFNRSASKEGKSYVHDKENQPVITGIGLVSPYGVGKEKFIARISSENNVLSSLQDLGEEWFAYEGGLVDMAPVRELIPPKRRRHLNKLGSFLTVSTQEAIADAVLSGNLSDLAMTYGSAYGCSSNVHAFYTQLLSKSPTSASPQEFMLSVTNAPPALVAQNLGIKGPLWVFVADEASWDMTLHWAAKLINFGVSEKIIVSAADEISESILAIHNALGFMKQSGTENFVLGEGALTMVLESSKSAKARKARVYGTLLSWASTQDCTCGPMDFSKSATFLNRANEHCFERNFEKISSLLSVGPANNWPVVDKLGSTVFETLQTKGHEVIRRDYRPRFGECGATGGFALAAALLSDANKKHSHALVQTSARGGMQAATLVRIGQNRS